MTVESTNQVEANKATVKRILERLSAGDITGFTDALAPDYIRHSQAMPPELREIQSRDTMHKWLISNKEAFPDYREELEYVMGEGDMVAWRSRGSGTHKGTFGPFPATGKQIDVVIIGMHRFEGGKIAETWTSWDNLAILMQLGLMPEL